MNTKQRAIRNAERAKIIYHAIADLPQGEAIATLEAIKIDLVLNTGIVTLDGMVGLNKKRSKPYI
jgi:hypothetical protein